MTVKAGQTAIRVRLRVTGRVQGVYFRASTRDVAEGLGLSGWVRNADDGAVELEAEGAPTAVEELYRWCANGPPAARVEHVERTEMTPTGAAERFQVRH
jgi:acylphosphatase